MLNLRLHSLDTTLLLSSQKTHWAHIRRTFKAQYSISRRAVRYRTRWRNMIMCKEMKEYDYVQGLLFIWPGAQERLSKNLLHSLVVNYRTCAPQRRGNLPVKGDRYEDEFWHEFSIWWRADQWLRMCLIVRSQVISYAVVGAPHFSHSRILTLFSASTSFSWKYQPHYDRIFFSI